MSDRSLPEPVDVLGIPVHPLTVDDFVGFIAAWCARDQTRRIYHVNTHAMNLAARNADFKASLSRADLIYCDGAGVQLGARILGASIPERLSVIDWLDSALVVLAQTGSSVFLLGDEPDVVRSAATTMNFRHQNLSVVGHHHGFFEKSGPDNDQVIKDLQETKPDVILVGMGMPMQELWIEQNIDRLPPSVLIPVGAAFRWYSGIQQRPPRWMREHGLEWLGRLWMEPRRLGRRYLLGNPEFLARVIRARMTGGSR